MTGIHVRRTRLAMPPLPLNDEIASTLIGALVAETLAETLRDERLDEGAAALQEDEQLDRSTEAVVQASLTSSPARLVALVSTVVAVVFAIAFFVTRPSTVAAPAGPRSTAVVAAASVVELPKMSIPAAAASIAPVASSEPSPSKPPPTLADGDWMLRHGQVQRAEEIYRSMLASGGSECESLTGLGKASLANHQPSEAQAFFERALARQPQYFPARLGRADALWDAGRRDASKAHYAAIRERYSDTEIPSRVIERTR